MASRFLRLSAAARPSQLNLRSHRITEMSAQTDDNGLYMNVGGRVQCQGENNRLPRMDGIISDVTMARKQQTDSLKVPQPYFPATTSPHKPVFARFPSRLPLYSPFFQRSISTSYSRVPFLFNPISAADCIKVLDVNPANGRTKGALTPFSPRLDLLQSGPQPKVQNKHGPFFKQQIQLRPPKQDVCR